MSALPGYISGNVSTYFSDQIRKHLNLKRSALSLMTQDIAITIKFNLIKNDV